MPPTKKKPKTSTLLPRSKVKLTDTWDLASLFANDAAWEKDFLAWEKQIKRYADFEGTLVESAQQLAKCLEFDTKFDRRAERIGTYAFLKTTEDTANSEYQRMIGRYQHAASAAGQAASFIRPEILAIPAKKFAQFLQEKPLAPFRLMLERIVRYRPHTLSNAEEKLLAMQSKMSDTANHAFRQLTDADFKFGMIKDEKGETIELSQSSFSALLHSPKRTVRSTAFHQFYEVFAGHENVLAATLNGSVERDVYYAQARGYKSAIESALFHDNVPISVYNNLIAAVRSKLPALYRYYDLRRRKMKLKDIHHYDTYVPILSDLDQRRTWQQAVKTVIGSLEPLGSEYVGVLERGLTTDRWCDRYPNRGKQSGAFSCGTFDSSPYIMMNYQPSVLDHVFTLTHEAGHSMHSYYSSSNQPFQYYNYVIFVAEVASTFNEQLLSRHLMAQAGTTEERAYLINRDIDAIRGTIIRQTMFAEFEKIIHALSESGEPLTIDRLKSEYYKLLEVYFGPEFTIDPQLKLECLRIPHFYRAFYVYKYATGLSAAIALSERVLNGGQQELTDYLSFLKGGCSKFPLDLLRDAGVDMEKPAPVNTALERFESLVDELDTIL
ncbi:oligoendopeptidase F [Bythopirellula polymerisocia]|uniref:Oligopeptidase F n=1 Tax=Bythopirellula polymerisocia TaxID=2528003 RepID=A0A5C6D3H7_9BACT|nr:oligoendopeptidase F [Bythopirellula polymerisocia]TWU30424.1 Oligoendopeptidase F, plasmid [Bythopirellula polymerisocia]